MGSLRSSELLSGVLLFPQLLTLVTSASSHITHWYVLRGPFQECEPSVTGRLYSGQPPLQLPGTHSSRFLVFFSFGKNLLFLFPEGGSERKKMSLFEALGILLQNRWNTGHPRCPPVCAKALVKEAMAPQSGVHRRQGCSLGNVASEPSAE